MDLLENFKRISKEYEFVSRYDGNIVDDDDLIYDLYYSILRNGCSSKNLIGDELEMLMYILNYVRVKGMKSIFELLSIHYLINKRHVSDIFSDMRLN